MKKIIGLFIIAGIVVYGAYEALMYYDNNFRYGRMRETPAVRPHEDPLLIMEEGIVPVNGGDSMIRASAAGDLIPAVNMDDPAQIARGKAVYLTYCAQCHGYNHDGNGTVGQSFYPLPTDLRGAKVQFQKDGYLFHDISFGSPNGRQPALATTVSITERWQVVAYIKSLGLR